MKFIYFLMFFFSTAALADHHGHNAGKMSFVSNGQFSITKVKSGDISFTAAGLKGLANVGASSYESIPSGTVLSFSCAASSLDKDGRSTLYALCSVKDKDGDEFSLENNRVGIIGQGGPGESVLRGVSGKYANLMGTCKYVPTYMMNDGVFVSVSFDCDMKH